MGKPLLHRKGTTRTVGSKQLPAQQPVGRVARWFPSMQFMAQGRYLVQDLGNANLSDLQHISTANSRLDWATLP